jgi:hypothetical protein
VTTVRKQRRSSLVAHAMREREHELLGTYLRELDTAFGPVPPKLLKEVRNTWDKRR